jgi:hypothetical protein
METDMARVTQIEVFVSTGGVSFAGTNGTVYAGIAGREFVLDTAGNDFKPDSSLVYVMGEGTNLKNGGTLSGQNIDTVDVPNFPAYIRFEPRRGIDKWELKDVRMTVNPGPEQIGFIAPVDTPDKVMLGDDCGKYVFLLLDT